MFSIRLNLSHNAVIVHKKMIGVTLEALGRLDERIMCSIEQVDQADELILDMDDLQLQDGGRQQFTAEYDT